MDLVKLRTELDGLHPGTTDPYDADNAIAMVQINAVNRTNPESTITGSQIFNATDDSEFTALSTNNDRERWVSLCGILDIDTGTGIAKSLEAELFGGGTNTRANLLALMNPPASRAVELGLGIVGEGDIAAARAL